MALLAMAGATTAGAQARASGGGMRRDRLIGDSVVVDMLAPLSLDLGPAPYARTLTAEEAQAFRSSGVTVMHNAAGVGGPDAQTRVLGYLAGWNGFIAAHADLFLLARRVGDFDRAKATGRIAVIMGVQNADHFRSPKDVAQFHQLGQRCAQLTYNSQNLLGAGATERVDGGLSDFGAAVIEQMNAVGMLVDVSHCGDRTTLDAIEASKGPIAITHTNCRALVPGHPRLKTDEAIRKAAAKGGVIGISGVRNFVRGEEPTSVEHIVDHIDHVVRIAGIDHVGLGSDSDLNGYDRMAPDQLAKLKAGYASSYGFRQRLDTDGYDHPRRLFDLTDALIRRGYTDAQIRAVLGGNFRRLLGEVWK
ncbi:dipeptidase [Caulobacter mirabilis]|uniref:Dipeptidase n=1 Tax=Caulobacter mirabilis TaxID=69666 RepID=A0A2D2AZD0_9CAUL|nr:membrane dipeptidase [Caulobacter mirabilis]ATQ43370.1 dipeptidase [Caulobacter mirabilis]